jgi:hypothetical protein
MTAHNQWLSNTRSIPYWTTSVFSSAVTDLVLIYESLTSGLRMNSEWRITYEWLRSSFSFLLRLLMYDWTPELLWAFSRVLPLHLREGPNTDHHLQQLLYYRVLIRFRGNLCFLLSWSLGIHFHFPMEMCVNFVATLWFPKESYLRGNMFAKLFPRNAYMSQYHEVQYDSPINYSVLMQRLKGKYCTWK